jgi:phosphate transport system permease protein
VSAVETQAAGRIVAKRQRKERQPTSLSAHGEPFVWLAGGAMAICLAMISGLLALVLWQGGGTFWPAEVVVLDLVDGSRVGGEVNAEEDYAPAEQAFAKLPAEAREAARRSVSEAGGETRRRMLRVGNYEHTGQHYQWASDFEVVRESRPEWMLVVERLARGTAAGRFYGEPRAFELDGKAQAEGPEASWRAFEAEHARARSEHARLEHLQSEELGAINAELEVLRLRVRGVELRAGAGSTAHLAAQEQAADEDRALRRRFAEVEREAAALSRELARRVLVLETADGKTTRTQLSDVVLAYPANQLGLLDKLGVYVARWSEFLFDQPREANSEGGVWPAIFGTVVMTLLMSLAVVPFGVLAALYLREYAKPGPLVSTVRIAVNNLAGVPSIVFGVFGLGFFCYICGASIDQLLYSERLPNPTFGKGGVLWASFTLALLTLPVVIVATEEALAAVPGSMREGSYACGATKWQTIQRIVLPRAMPGIMTGMILAIARGAGEVAPLMLVGAVKVAPEMAVDGTFPYLHPERSFMHLGFHIYDLGFQSPNSEAAKPMVYTTTLLLILLIVLLNVAAIWVRNRLRRRYAAGVV